MLQPLAHITIYVYSKGRCLHIRMEQKQVPHVLLMPFPAQGHVNPMLKLAELLCLAGLHVTFLITEDNHKRLVSFTDANSRFSRFTYFRFEAISDGISDDKRREDPLFEAIYEALHTVIKPAMRDLLISGRQLFNGWPPVTCIIADGFVSFTVDVAKEFGIPSIIFHTQSAACTWAYLCIRRLIQEDELPFKDDNLDQRLTCVPGMENFLRRRDLPSFLRSNQLDDPTLQELVKIYSKSLEASAFILNTVNELEYTILSHMESLAHVKIYTIGPLSVLLSSKNISISSASLCAVDYSCLTWLNSQPKKSVIYVSLGSVAVVTADQMLEFWYGLVNSGKPFLWVLRPKSIRGEYKTPEELLYATKERGYIVDWSPQEQVLKHPSVGGFLTHSGWNSTMEAMVAGIPMLCWPFNGDQHVNSRLVEAVWNNGIDMKDTCDRLTVEKMVRDLMEERRNDFLRSSEKVAEIIKNCVKEGRSSYQNFERLIEDIRCMSL